MHKEIGCEIVFYATLQADPQFLRKLLNYFFTLALYWFQQVLTFEYFFTISIENFNIILGSREESEVEGFFVYSQYILVLREKKRVKTYAY